jgi:hypothetical protein
MNVRRFGEKGQAPLRTGRIYSVGTEWYAATRGGEDLGPFTSEEEARLAVGDYLTELLEGEDRLAGATAAERADRAEMRLQEVRDFLHRRESEGPAAARLWAEQRLEQLDREPMASPERRERRSALEDLLSQH